MRPLRVFKMSGKKPWAWACHKHPTPVIGYGHPSQGAALAAALAHCREGDAKVAAA